MNARGRGFKDKSRGTTYQMGIDPHNEDRFIIFSRLPTEIPKEPYYLALNSFTEGWLSGDGVEVIGVAEGYEQYDTYVTLEATWPSSNLDLGPRLLPTLLTDVTNPFKVDLLKLEYLCSGNSGSYNYGALTYKYSYNNDVTIPPTAGTDGVVIKGYIRAQDDGSWVPGGKKYRVFSNLGLKIEKNIGQHVYYGDDNDDPVQIHLTDNNGNEYYDISNNNGEVIDPIHYVILPKDGSNYSRFGSHR